MMLPIKIYRGIPPPPLRCSFRGRQSLVAPLMRLLLGRCWDVMVVGGGGGDVIHNEAVWFWGFTGHGKRTQRNFN